MDKLKCTSCSVHTTTLTKYSHMENSYNLGVSFPNLLLWCSALFFFFFLPLNFLFTKCRNKLYFYPYDLLYFFLVFVLLFFFFPLSLFLLPVLFIIYPLMLIGTFCGFLIILIVPPLSLYFSLPLVWNYYYYYYFFCLLNCFNWLLAEVKPLELNLPMPMNQT